jgi:predicted AAA+ superfamily ATPase
VSKSTLNLALSRILRQQQVLILHGPTFVGKRILAEQIGKELRKKILPLDLSKSNDRRRIIHPDLFFSSHHKELIFIESVDRMPSILEDVRRYCLKFKNHPRFILSTDLQFQVIFKYFQLPKRTFIQEVFPASLLSIKSTNSTAIWQHWLKGGFPGFLSAPSNRVLSNRAERLLDKLVSNDSFPIVGHQLDRNTIRTCLELIAQLNGSILNFQVLARAMGVTGPTVLRYIRFLEASFMIRLLPALAADDKKRLSKAPKIFIRDSGILHHLLGVQSLRSLSKSTCQAASWEGYVIEEIAKILPQKYQLHYYRTQHAAEVQLIISKNGKKAGSSPRPFIAILLQTGQHAVVGRAIKNCFESLATRKNYLVQVTNNDDFPSESRDQGLKSINCTPISLAELLKMLSSLR